MAFERLGLVDLIAPEYLAGLDFPEYIHRYLSILGIDEMHTHSGAQAVVYNGVAGFSGDGAGSPEISHNDPSGNNLTFPADAIRFRLTIPRDGAAFIGVEANSSSNGKLPEVALLLNDLAEGITTEPMTNSDFPGTKFKLELFINNVRFSLGDDWVAGEFDAALHKVVPHTDPRFSGKPVEMVMPGLAFTFTQGDDPDRFAPIFSLDSFKSYGLDAPHDLAIGELIRMEPGIALHTSGHVAFSVEQIVLDSSPENTPPELLAHFGVGDDWQGLFIKQLLFYYNNDQSLGFAVRIADALIGFDGRVSFEAELDIYPNPDVTELTVEPKFFHGSNPIYFFHRGKLEDGPETPPSGDPPGQIMVSQGDVMQLDIKGAIAPFYVEVLQDGTDLWNATDRQVVFDTVGHHNIFIKVNDSVTPEPHKYREYIKVIVVPLRTAVPPSGTPADRPAETQPVPALSFSRTNQDATHDLEMISEEGTLARFKVTGAGDFSVTITQNAGGTSERIINNEQEFSIDVQPGTSYTLAVNHAEITPATPVETKFVNFRNDHPLSVEINDYINGSIEDVIFSNSLGELPNYPESELSNVTLDGFASNNPSDQDRDIRLSRNRVQVIQNLLRPRYSSSIMPELDPASDSLPNYHGHTGLPFSPDSNAKNRCVRITFSFASTPAHTMNGELSRDALPIPDDDDDENGELIVGETPPAAPPHLNGIPPAIKLLGVRVKIDNNKLSLLELYAKVDFETDLEKQLRETPDSDPEGTLDMSHEGVVDMKLGYVYDRASQETTVSVLFHTEEGDTSGLINFENNENRDNRLKNIAGALLLFAPILNASTEAVIADPEDVGAWITLAASFATPVAIGGLNVFRTRKAVLYGVEGKFKWVRPKDGFPGRWDFGIVLDYGVEFDIVVEMLGIGLDRLPKEPGDPPRELPPPLKARYRAIGFNIVRGEDGSAKYQAVFDSSKGYELDLSDPSLFRLPDPLGTLFNVVGARVARFNPTTFEIDFAIKVDLGVITVDRFKLKIPLEPTGNPQIMPSGVRVDIPGVIVGNGFVNVVNADVVQPDGSTIESKGIEGGIDLTLKTLKLRVAASVALGSISESGREAVAVFVGIEIEFPSPVIIAGSGLGLYGLSGLFAMHYRRTEVPNTNPNDAVGPALRWLIKAKGEPQDLYNDDDVQLWAPAFDRWSFGVGAILGTLEGGYLINMQGMFVLELPGPRILIMIKMRLIEPKVKINTEPEKLAFGMIGVLDLDFQQMQLTVGVMINYEIKELLQVSIPIELYSKLDDPSKWHLRLGTIMQPASANILNIARGTAYFMLQGYDFVYPSTDPVPAFLRDKVLSGIAIATGISASILLGDPDTIYLKIAARADLGVSFSPFLIIGTLRIEGKLRLLIVSIGAHGAFDVMVSKRADESFKTYVHGEVCGEVDFFFFSISACIDLTIGTPDKLIVPPKLIRGIYLQSYSPVLVSGQGGNLKPIDASLGNAIEVAHGAASPNSGLPIVPIDSVIVLQLQVAPQLDTALNSNTFSKPIANAPGRPSDGWYKLSDDVKVKYTIKSLTLKENSSSYSGEKPPATWRIDRPHQPNGADTAIDLALFSRVPTAAEFAVEQSTELKNSVTVRWENACKLPAPPTRVLYTFCNQPLGPSLHGWQVKGIALPDPEGTIRTELPKTQMAVYAPETCGVITPFDLLLAEMGYQYDEPAEIVGDEKPVQTIKQAVASEPVLGHLTPVLAGLPDHRPIEAIDLSGLAVSAAATPSVLKKCFSLVNRRGFELNPATIEKEFKIFSSTTKAKLYSETKGFVTEDDFLRANPLHSPLLRDMHLMRGFLDRRGFDIKEFMRIDILKGPVSEISIAFSSSQNTSKTILYAEAYNTEMKLVERKEWKPRVSPIPQTGSISLSGKNIAHVIIGNKNFVGLLSKVCIKRKGSKPEDNDGKCSRALQLPWLNVRANKKQVVRSENKLDPEKIKQYYAEKECCRYVTFDTDACESAIFFGAVYSKFIKLIRVQELDGNDKILKEYKLSDADYKFITNPTAELPPKWLDANLPWHKCALPVLQFMFSSKFKAYEKILINIKPESNEKCKKIRFNVCMVDHYMPSMYLAIADLLTMAEVQHNQTLTEIQESDRMTLDAYVNDHTPIPLMKPNKTYRLGINYEVTTSITGESDVTESFDQDFVFKTDNKAPEVLGSYVLGATPETGEGFHFYGDELTVVFNDPEVLRLYEAYGKHLRAIIRSADGAPVSNNPDTIHTLEEIPAEVNSPYRTMVEALLQSGLLPCMGSMTFKQHGSYKTPYLLKPLMQYTFDIEFVEPDVLDPEKAIVPLYRQAFSTSRYENLKDFAKAHRELPLNHRALTADLSGLPTFSQPEQVITLTDREIQDSLTTAGIPLTQSGVTILWKQVGASFKPIAVVLATGEPVWKRRIEPKKKLVLGNDNQPIDPAFVIYEKTENDHLKLMAKVGENNVKGFIKSTGGTTTIIVLNDDLAIPPSGKNFTINAVRPASSLYGLAEQSETILKLILLTKAPWED